ncbi:MAG: hypothetical protein methR_P2091 [Methyloprofundus sp.]|nr:MAG: hypothetical protein methR_P2091 [Methyloprofundus sp.]
MPKLFYLIILSLLLTPLVYANDDDDMPTHTAAEDAFTVHLEEDTQLITAIKTQTLVNSQYKPELISFATRVDLAPLINIRQQYFSVLAQQSIAEITLNQEQERERRAVNLQRNNAVSTRKLHEQQNQLKIAAANLNALRQQANHIRLHTNTTWGRILSHWFLTEKYPPLQMLSTFNKPLYLVYFPPSISTPSANIVTQAFGLREQAQTASFVGPAFNYVNGRSQQTGSPFFYLSDQEQAAAHQRVTVWLPMQKQTLTGVKIPSSALIWHLGQAFVYLQVNDETFQRIKITHKKLINSDTYFIQEALQQNDILVTTGAQMLLSEEFRGQIPAEDDDDDD